MAGWMEERKEQRFYQEIGTDKEISARSYNLTIGGVLLYGLLMNAILCYVFSAPERMVMLLENYLFLIIAYVVCCIAGIMLSSKSNNPVLSFVGYNLVAVPVGLIVSISVFAYGGIGSEIVTQAFVITLLITGFMVAASMYKPEFFEGLGGMLLVCLLGLVVAEIILLIFRVDQVITAWIGAGLFSLYIGYDFYKAQQYPKTVDNAVDSALDIYLDVINLFLRILRILGSRGRSSRR